MKIFKTTICLLLFITISHNILAQDYKDCETAFQLCGESPFIVESSIGTGIEDEGISTSCLMSEGNSTWISLSILKEGILTFDLVPNGESNDLDFIVFKRNDANDCSDKELIRCMASGENVGNPQSEWENCTGPTGLQIGETDTIEDAGCQLTDNNYLAPIQTSQGDHYLLMVNNFSQSGQGFELSFGGDAELDCISVDTKDVNSNENVDFEINPSVSKGLFRLAFNENYFIGAKVLIHDINGKLVFNMYDVRESANDINLSEQGSGVYVVSVYKGNSILNKRFIIAK